MLTAKTLLAQVDAGPHIRCVSTAII